MIKRLFDTTFSFFGLIILSPFLLIITILIKIDSKGPIFYKGIRVGKNGKTFKQYKFRTMIKNAEKLGGSTTAFNDHRITKIGRFLRKYKLDELPQLINVLKGEMSLVGPRPELKEHTDLYNNEEKKILSVKPGMTDYASIKFASLDQLVGSKNADEVYAKKIRNKKNQLRLYYVNNRSFWKDIKIIIQTISTIFKKVKKQ